MLEVIDYRDQPHEDMITRYLLLQHVKNGKCKLRKLSLVRLLKDMFPGTLIYSPKGGVLEVHDNYQGNIQSGGNEKNGYTDIFLKIRY